MPSVLVSIREGSTGGAVRAWQTFLRGRGALDVVADGNFGPRTTAATEAYQASKGLTADGIVGAGTYAFAIADGLPVVVDPTAAQAGPSWPPRPTNLAPLSKAEREARFGRFAFVSAPGADPDTIRITDGWEAQNIVTVTVPQLKHIGHPLTAGHVQIHRKLRDDFLALWQAWEDAGLLDRVLAWDGSFVPRFQRGSRTALSNHAWGTAFDLNAATNALGATPALVGQTGCVRELVEIANAHGFFWGGHFQTRADGMHFEAGKSV